MLFFGNLLFSQSNTPSVGPAPENSTSSLRQLAPPQLLNANSRGWCYNGATNFQFNKQFMGNTALTPIGPAVPFVFPGASAWVTTTNQLLVVDQSSPYPIYSVDTTSGARTQLTTCTGVPFSNFTGMAWDHTTNTMYGVATDVTQSQIFTVNLSTGVCTAIGTPSTVAPAAIMLNVSPGGILYSVDIVTNNLYRWNKTTGVPTLVGSLGVDPNFGQDGYFDFSDGTYYWAAYTGGPELRTIDTLTGASTLIGPYSGGQVQTLTLRNNVCNTTSSSQTLAGCSGFTVTVGTNTYSVTGIYQDTLVNAAGCDSIVTTNLTIDPISDAGLIVVDTAICEGTNITMSTSGNTGNISWYLFDGNNYTFISSGTTASTTTPPAAGTYSIVTVATSGLCPSDTFIYFPVNVYSPSDHGYPYTSISGTDLCAGDSIVFMDSLFTGNIDWLVSLDSGATWSNFGSGNNYNPGPPSNNDIGNYMFAVVAVNGVCPADTSGSFSIDVRPTPVVFVGNDTTLCGNSITLDTDISGESYLWSNGDTTQTSIITASGIYNVTVTTQYGCAGHDTIAIAINNNPIVNLGADTSSCGNLIQLDAQNAGASYLWNDNSTSQTITATVSGTYFVTVTDTNACSASDTISVTINTPPSVTGSASATTVCTDDANVTLTGSPLGGTWSGPGVSGNSFDPSVGVGVQTVMYMYTDSNRCEGTFGVSITVDACVGITESNAPTFTAFPVPFQNVITIIANNSGEYHVRIMNAAGQVVIENKFIGNRAEIHTESLASGLYWIEIAGANGTQVIKVTK